MVRIKEDEKGLKYHINLRLETWYRWLKSWFLGHAGSRVVRAHATNAVDPGSNLAGGPVLHVTPHLSPLSDLSTVK